MLMLLVQAAAVDIPEHGGSGSLGGILSLLRNPEFHAGTTGFHMASPSHSRSAAVSGKLKGNRRGQGFQQVCGTWIPVKVSQRKWKEPYKA